MVDSFKARGVASGNPQVYGKNHLGTYAPVDSISLALVFLYIALNKNFCMAQVDVKTALPNVVLEEDIWVVSP